MDAIAQEAAVFAETVYAVFKNKRTVLARLVDVSVVGVLAERTLPGCDLDRGLLARAEERSARRRVVERRSARRPELHPFE